MVNVSAVFFDGRFRKIAERAVELFSTLPGMGDRRGGYFCVRSGHLGAVEIVFRVGEIPIEKIDKCFALSLEKGERLHKHYEHQSSWQSRDEVGIVNGQSWGHWGGAVFLRQHLVCLSFSGIPELGDEAVVLFTALFSGLATLQEVRDIVKISSNPYFELLYEKAMVNRWMP